MLVDAVADYALETGAAALPAAHFIEWLAEWGGEARRRPHGLLLLTAHRAKGLEFDHVIVLDGGWPPRAGEDADAMRRLRYVAMTRARATLALMRFATSPRRPLPAALERDIATPDSLPPELDQRYLRLTPRDVDIGFAGRRPRNDPVHAAIAALRVGDALSLRITGPRREWLAQGVVVGRLSRAFAIDDGWHCLRATVAAVLVRRADQGDDAFRAALQSDTWELVLPEIVLTRVTS